MRPSPSICLIVKCAKLERLFMTRWTSPCSSWDATDEERGTISVSNEARSWWPPLPCRRYAYESERTDAQQMLGDDAVVPLRDQPFPVFAE